jgi:16S rRNA (cytosine967-C5)-methyltransferase
MSIDLLRAALPTELDPDLARSARKPFLRDAALEALAHGRENIPGAGKALARWFRQARRLGSRDRPIVSEGVYGMIRHEHLLIRAGARSPEELHEAWCRMMEGDRFEQIESSSPAEDLATAMSIPFLLAQEWLEYLGEEEVVELAQSLGKRAPMTIRANRLQLSREELAQRLADEEIPTTPTRFAPDGLHLGKRVALGNLETWKTGAFEVQDESGQRFIEAIPGLGPGVEALDLCAGAGGKSLAMASRGARVHAWDVRSKILGELRRRAERAGAEIVIDTPEPADVVVLDSPCSGTGRLRREPALRWGLEILARVDLQQELIEDSACLVREGGILAYATCSLVAAENGHGPPSEGVWTELDRQVLWPHRDGCDGFGWVIWRRGPS